MWVVLIDKGYQSGRRMIADGEPFFSPLAWFAVPEAAQDYAEYVSKKLDCLAKVEYSAEGQE